MIWKWTSRGFSFYNKQDYGLAEQCATFTMYFREFTPPGSMARAQPFLCRALTRYEVGNITGAQADINEIKRLDTHLAMVKSYLF